MRSNRLCWMQVLSILLRGNYEASLLGKAAVHDVLRALLSHMTAPQAEDQAGEEAIADMPALHALDAAIFSQAVLLDDSHSGLRPVAVEALVAIFQIAWQSEGPELVETAASDPGEGDNFFDARHFRLQSLRHRCL